MIGLNRNTRVWVMTKPADLRRSYDGLSAIVRQQMSRELLCGDLFVFINKRRNRIKVLWWDGTGLCIHMKRPENGRFANLHDRREPRGYALTQSELLLLLEGNKVVGRQPLSPEDITSKFLAGS